MRYFMTFSYDGSNFKGYQKQIKERTIQGEIEKALKANVDKIIIACKSVLEETPPELSADIIENGAVLTGGGSLLHGFKELLEEELQIPIYLAESPLTSVAEGTGIMLDNLYLLD